MYIYINKDMYIYWYIYICMEMYVNIWKYMDNVTFLERKMERWWWIHLSFLLSTRTYVWHVSSEWLCKITGLLTTNLILGVLDNHYIIVIRNIIVIVIIIISVITTSIIQHDYDVALFFFFAILLHTQTSPCYWFLCGLRTSHDEWLLPVGVAGTMWLSWLPKKSHSKSTQWHDIIYQGAMDKLKSAMLAPKHLWKQ